MVWFQIFKFKVQVFFLNILLFFLLQIKPSMLLFEVARKIDVLNSLLLWYSDPNSLRDLGLGPTVIGLKSKIVVAKCFDELQDSVFFELFPLLKNVDRNKKFVNRNKKFFNYTMMGTLEPPPKDYNTTYADNEKKIWSKKC